MITPEDDLKMVENHEQWPIYPLLPMKRFNKEKKFGFPVHGVICALDRTPVVYIISVFEIGGMASTRAVGADAIEIDAHFAGEAGDALKEKLNSVEKKFKYKTVAEMLEDGWVVD